MHDRAAHFLAQLSTRLLSSGSMEDTVAAAFAGARDVMPEADHASITLSRRRGHEHLAATSTTAQYADELQYSVLGHPCVEDATDTAWVRSGELGQDPRWPTYGPKVAEAGVRSMLSLRLRDVAGADGALTLYADTPDRFADPEAIDLAQVFAIHVADALMVTRRLEGLETALHHRHVIGVAQGIVMCTHEVELDTSFEVLTRYSNNLNRKVHDVAEYVARRGRLPEQDDFEAESG